jgi:hypothetical protein
MIQIGAIVAATDERQLSVAIGGSGILEKGYSKRNRKVFHKSLSLLWIADVEYC